MFNSYIQLLENHQILAVVVDREWVPGIGDPTFFGWFTVLAYLATAVLCVLCAKQAAIARKRYSLDDEDEDVFLPRKRPSPLRWLWWSLGIILLVLAVNKQLDLQTWFTVTARDLAKSEGWYAQRRMYQVGFIIAIASIMFLLITIIGIAIRYYLSQVWLAILGLGLLSSFIIIRAVSFHHIDILLGWSIGGFRLNSFLELGGISCIALANLKYLRWV